MRCLKCKENAVIELRQHNASYCRTHFLSYFTNRVRQNIEHRRMFAPDDRILVAVSGGKDSLALWDVLLGLGFNASGLHLHLGIGEYSNLSLEKTRHFASSRGAELIEVNLAKEYGMGVTELSSKTGRVPCSACGQSKRYLFNKVALDRGFSVLATGHNLDDEAATLLGNVLSWQTQALARQSPVLPRTRPTLVKKVKPLYTLTERETALYCLLKRIDYVEDECPNALGAKSLLFKEVLNRLEENMPGVKQSFVKLFLKRIQPLLKSEQDVDVRDCAVCGQPTTREICAFCSLWQKALSGGVAYNASSGAQIEDRRID